MTSDENTDLLKLEKLRAEQDAVDKKIVAALAERYKLREKISAFRIENGLPTVDEARKKYVLDQAAELAKEKGIPEDYVVSVFHVLIEASHGLDRQWRQDFTKPRME